jgi:hypothetical protein
MSQLRTNSIVIRGQSHVVSELTAKGMRAARKMIADEPGRAEVFIASICCVEPKYTEAELAELPQIFADKISAEAFRLTKDDDAPNA